MATTLKKFDWLPSGFRNVVVECRNVSDNNFVATVRSSAATKEELVKWRKEFETQTNTHWTIRHTYPHMKRLAVRIDLVCQHSSFNKSTSTKRATKNCNCGATMSQKVKVISRHTKDTDRHVKDGLPAVIKIKNIHNHSTDSIVTLHYLPASADCREAFIEYFSGGMGVAEAIKYHANVLRLRKDFTESQLDDGSINPKQRTVYYWYGQWRRQRIGAETGHLFNSLVKTSLCEHVSAGATTDYLPESNTEEVSSEMNGSSTAVVDDFESVLDRMRQLHQRFGSSPAACSRMLSRLDHINTASLWENFLRCSSSFERTRQH